MREQALSIQALLSDYRNGGTLLGITDYEAAIAAVLGQTPASPQQGLTDPGDLFGPPQPEPGPLPGPPAPALPSINPEEAQ
jgi:hypothetical protein